MNFKENFIANFLYIIIGLVEEYNNNKDKNGIDAKSIFSEQLRKVRHEYAFPSKSIHCQFDIFIDNRMKEIQEDFTYILKTGVRPSVIERFELFIKTYTDESIRALIIEFQNSYPALFDAEPKCKLKQKAFHLLEVSRKIEKFCEKLKDIEDTFIEFVQPIWDGFLTSVNSYSQANDYSLIVHRTCETIKFFNECDNIRNWIKAEKGFLCASLITKESHNLYKMCHNSYIAGYGFVLKMDMYKLASISKADNYTNFSFFGLSISEYRKCPTNYFKRIITNVNMNFSNDSSRTKIPVQLNNGKNDGYSEFVFDFTECGYDLIIGVFCMVNSNIAKNENDDELITALKSFSNKTNLKFITLTL
jgi:hypothetical protein